VKKLTARRVERGSIIVAHIVGGLPLPLPLLQAAGFQKMSIVSVGLLVGARLTNDLVLSSSLRSQNGAQSSANFLQKTNK